MLLVTDRAPHKNRIKGPASVIAMTTSSAEPGARVCFSLPCSIAKKLLRFISSMLSSEASKPLGGRVSASPRIAKTFPERRSLDRLVVRRKLLEELEIISRQPGKAHGSPQSKASFHAGRIVSFFHR
jgi:hypothetical protein